MPRLLAVLAPIALALTAWGPATDVITVTPAAKVQTEPVPSEGDAADDPAIWIHPADPARSLVLGTDKKGGLHAYSLDGRRRQLVSPGSRPNNVDVLYGFRLARPDDRPGRRQRRQGGEVVGGEGLDDRPGRRHARGDRRRPDLQDLRRRRSLRPLHLPQPARRRGLRLRHRPRRGGGTIPPRSSGREHPDTRSDPRPRLPRRLAGRGDRRRPRAGQALRRPRRTSASGSTGPNRATAPTAGPWPASASTA